MTVTGLLPGHGAVADTILNFDAHPPGQAQDAPIIQTFGDNAASSGSGVSATGGGTPNIDLTWSGPGILGGGVWHYYIDTVWSAGRLLNSSVGTIHSIQFTPEAGLGVALNSFNFHPYFSSGETFDYTWSVSDGATTLKAGPSSFFSNGEKDHPVDINYTGNLGQALTLNLFRIGGTGDANDIAIDDLSFGQVPVPEPSALALVTLGTIAGTMIVVHRRRRTTRF